VAKSPTAAIHEVCESIANGTLNAARRLNPAGTPAERTPLLDADILDAHIQEQAMLIPLYSASTVFGFHCIGPDLHSAQFSKQYKYS
jgi:hypothetical protein